MTENTTTPTTAERIVEVADDLGIDLMPWQREVIAQAFARPGAAPVVVRAGRRAGMATIRRVIDRLAQDRPVL